MLHDIWKHITISKKQTEITLQLLCLFPSLFGTERAGFNFLPLYVKITSRRVGFIRASNKIGSSRDLSIVRANQKKAQKDGKWPADEKQERSSEDEQQGK